MSDAVVIQIIQSIGTFGGLIITGYVAYKIAGIHKQLNSMRDQENATNRQLGNAEGRADEKDKQSKKASL